jgi:hypothetical protein
MRFCHYLLFIVIVSLALSCKKENVASTKKLTGNLNYVLQWNRAFGGTGNDVFHSGAVTSDGGYIAVGFTVALEAGVSYSKAIAVKFDANGNQLWYKVIGGSQVDHANAVCELKDGSLICIGSTESNDGDIKGNQGQSDILAFKLDKNGNTQWIKTIGTPGKEWGNKAIIGTDGAILITGLSRTGDDISNTDALLCKIDQNGNVLWSKTYGGTSFDAFYALVLSEDGGYVAAGTTSDNVGNATERKEHEIWIVKTDANGNAIWQKTFGGSSYEGARDIVQCNDGFVVVGSSYSSNGDISVNHGEADACILKIDQSGNQVWQTSLGGLQREEAWCVVRNTGGGFLIGVESESSDGDFPGNHGFSDAWIVKLDESGKVQGQLQVGGSMHDQIFDLMVDADGSYLGIGNTASPDAGAIGFNNGYDGWMLKLKNL